MSWSFLTICNVLVYGMQVSLNPIVYHRLAPSLIPSLLLTVNLILSTILHLLLKMIILCLNPFTFTLAIVSMIPISVWTLLIIGRLCLRVSYSSFLMVVHCWTKRSKGSLIVQGPFVLPEFDAMLVFVCVLLN